MRKEQRNRKTLELKTSKNSLEFDDENREEKNFKLLI